MDDLRSSKSRLRMSFCWGRCGRHSIAQSKTPPARLNGRRQRPGSLPLTNREREVLEGLVAGKPNKVIVFDLAISPRSVEIYRANVMTKMGAASLSELVRMALIVGVMNSGPRE